MNPLEGTITLYVQVVGKTTFQMSLLRVGEELMDLVGPFLGVPSDIEPIGTVVGIGGGLALQLFTRSYGNIIGPEQDHINHRRKVPGSLDSETRDQSGFGFALIATDDGSVGTHGFVTDVLATRLNSAKKINLVMAIGPLVMMQAVSEMTRPYGIKTMVSMNPIMMDGTGMCGACRVTVNGEMKFACIDGPEFDGHKVNFDEVLNRLKMYLPEEKMAMDRYREALETKCLAEG